MKTKKTSFQQRINSSFSIRFFLVTMMLVSFTVLQAQSFVCTDLTRHNTTYLDTDVFVGMKNQYLGETCTLKFYDRSLRMNFVESSIVLDRTTATQYKKTVNNGSYTEKYIIQLNKVGKEIKSFKYTVYADNIALFTITFKRKQGK